MKHLTTYPIESLSGTDKSEPKRTYYKYKGCQISRTYNPPPPPYNPSLNAGRAINDASLKAYKLLSYNQCQKWCSFCDSWNLISPSLVKPYNVWTAYCTVNFYRQLTGLSILSEPPSTYGSILLYSCELKTLPDLPLGGRFDAEVRNFPTSDGYCVFWLTKPYSNFPHAYRKPDSRLCSGFSPLSVAYIPDTSSPYQFIVDNLSYKILSNQYCYVDTRLITKDGFPMPVRQFSLLTEEAGMLFSYGDVWTTLIPGSFTGTHYNNQYDWSTDKTKSLIFCDDKSKILRIPFVLNKYCQITALNIIWSAPKGSNVQINLSLDEWALSLFQNSWESKKNIILTKSDPQTDLQYNLFEFSPYDVQDMNGHSISIEILTSDAAVIINGLSFKTCKRAY